MTRRHVEIIAIGIVLAFISGGAALVGATIAVDSWVDKKIDAKIESVVQPMQNDVKQMADDVREIRALLFDVVRGP